MLDHVLGDREQTLVAEERRVLGEVRVTLARSDTPREEQEALARSVAQLDELFLLVVVGEFNAGKSAFINALLGRPLLEEGVTPTTSRIGVLGHGPEDAREAGPGGVELLRAPVELLREIVLVDTPGTNAVLREHEELTREFVPRSDLVLFVTSADRPFTESERAFMETIRAWGKKVVVVVNKADILESREDLDRVREFVAERSEALLGTSPQVFAVSARRALKAKLEGDGVLLADSGFPALEEYVVRTLDETERLRLKLLNPVGVGERVLAGQLATARSRLDLLAADIEAIAAIESELGVYREDLSRDFRFRLADVEVVLHDFERRGEQYFDETLRLGRIFDLVNQSRIKGEFEKKVVADLPRTLELRVEAVIDWLVASDQREWRQVAERIARRQAEHGDRLASSGPGGFEDDRSRLLGDVRREAQRALAGYDQEAEAARLAVGVRDAVASAALLQVGALGLGTVVTMLATTTAVDVTGVLAAGAVSILGLLAIPHHRRKARAELRTKVAAMRRQLMGSLTDQFEREIQASLARIRESIAPYTRFVRAERERLEGLRGELGRLADELARLRARIEALAGD